MAKVACLNTGTVLILLHSLVRTFFRFRFFVHFFALLLKFYFHELFNGGQPKYSRYLTFICGHFFNNYQFLSGVFILCVYWRCFIDVSFNVRTTRILLIFIIAAGRQRMFAPFPILCVRFLLSSFLFFLFHCLLSTSTIRYIETIAEGPIQQHNII